MNTTNLLLIDDKQLMAGTFRRYFKHRFGDAVNVTIARDAESGLREATADTRIIILDYCNDGEHAAQAMKNMTATIKAQKPDTDIFVLSPDDDVKDDLVKAAKKMEKKASQYLKQNKKVQMPPALSLSHKLMFPVKVLVDEFTIRDFLVMYVVLFTIMGLFLLLVRPLFKLL